MNHLFNTDGGSAYMSTVSLMLGFLFKPDLSRLLIDSDADASLFKSKSCATRSIAKKYKSVTEMQKDNNTEDVYFDKEYDDTPYIIMSKYEEEKGKMLPDKFLEYFKMVLIEKHDANLEIVEEMAMNLIAKRRRWKPKKMRKRNRFSMSAAKTIGFAKTLMKTPSAICPRIAI